MLSLRNVIKGTALLGVASLSVSTQAIGIAEGQPTAYLDIDGSRLNLVVEPTSNGWAIPAGTIVGTDDGQVEFTQGVLMDPDPSIAYGFAVIDFGAPSVFGFTFASPIVPTGPGTLVASTLAAGLTDFTDNGIALTAIIPDIQTAAASSSGLAGPYSNLGVDIGPSFSAPGGATGLPVPYVYGPFAEGLIAGPAGGPFDALRVDLTFALSGDGDVAALTGSASIVTAATPDGGAGLAGLAAIAALLVTHSRKRA